MNNWGSQTDEADATAKTLLLKIKRHSFQEEILPRHMAYVDWDVGTRMVMYESGLSRNKKGCSGSIVTEKGEAWKKGREIL